MEWLLVWEGDYTRLWTVLLIPIYVQLTLCYLVQCVVNGTLQLLSCDSRYFNLNYLLFTLFLSFLQASVNVYMYILFYSTVNVRLRNKTDVLYCTVFSWVHTGWEKTADFLDMISLHRWGKVVGTDFPRQFKHSTSSQSIWATTSPYAYLQTNHFFGYIHLSFTLCLQITNCDTTNIKCESVWWL